MTPSIQSTNFLTDPKSAALSRLEISDRMPVPTIVKDEGGRILFDFTSPVDWKKPQSDLLERFVSAQSNADLLRFAKRFGPLALFHTKNGSRWPDPGRLADFCDPHYEELNDWRRCQQQMRAVLHLMTTLQLNDTPTIQALSDFNEMVGGAFVEPKVLEAAKSNAAWRRKLAQGAVLFYTRALANACRITPALRPKKTTLEIVFQDAIVPVPGSSRGGLSLPGALTLQLMSAFAGTAITLCTACGRAYLPKRRPAANRSRFCPDCGIRAAWRESKRKARDPEREK